MHLPLPTRRGFTLIELLVAISILALIAVLGWRGLDSLLRSRVALEAQLVENRQYQLIFDQMEADCAQLAPATLLDGAATLSALPGNLVLLRSATSANQPQRFQVVTYRMLGTQLSRSASELTRDRRLLQAEWQAALAAAAATARITLASNVAELTLRTRGTDGAWRQNGIHISGGVARTRRVVAPAGGASGIEVGLHIQGQKHALLRVFLLGPG